MQRQQVYSESNFSTLQTDDKDRDYRLSLPALACFLAKRRAGINALYRLKEVGTKTRAMTYVYNNLCCTRFSHSLIDSFVISTRCLEHTTNDNWEYSLKPRIS